MDDLDKKYDEWCERIAESRDLGEIISHFREHVGEHYNRRERESRINLNVWLVGALNFMYILEKKTSGACKEG